MAKLAQIDIFEHLDVVEYLKAIYELQKRSTQTYSYQQYAEDLGFGRSTLIYQIIQGSRRLTPQASKTIIKGLGLKKDQRKYFLAMSEYRFSTDETAREKSMQLMLEIRSKQLTSDLDRRMIEFLSAWYHPVVRELVHFDNFQADPDWIAKHCYPSITRSEAKHSFDLLVRLGFIEFDQEQNKWVQSDPVIEMPAEVASLALMRFQSEMIQMASESLREVEADDRDISGVMVSVSSNEFDEMKREIQEFRRHILSKYGDSGTPDQVVQVNMQLFPMSCGVSKDTNKQ